VNSFKIEIGAVSEQGVHLFSTKVTILFGILQNYWTIEIMDDSILFFSVPWGQPNAFIVEYNSSIQAF